MDNQKYVYISYAQKDRQIAEEVKKNLEANGICCLTDLSMPVGIAFGMGIPNGITNCDVFLVIVSENSQKSKSVLDELDLASVERKTIISFQIDDSKLTIEFAYYLARKEMIRAYNRTNEAIGELTCAISNIIKPKQELVYISYSSQDRQVAEEVKRSLEANGIGCFTDANIPKGVPYAAELVKAIKKCKTFLVVMSENSQESSNIFNEIQLAFNEEKQIISFFIEDFILHDTLRFLLDGRLMINAKNRFENAVSEVIQLVSNDCKKSDMATKKTKILSPYNGEKDFIFISYSHKNSSSVLEIVEKLINDGYRVWYDEGIDPGTEWDDFIAEKLEKCGYFIAFISEEYLGSDNCKDELNYARDIEKDRLLVYLTDVKLTGGLAMRLNRLQAIHKYTYSSTDAFLEKLKSTPALDKYID
ncbi:MAG: toll/interleukin-1 receptor domain-containing protein [Clostridia bacterium]|nr:toll/interleukin-1 receptor domain-containing protein [Clostridia bacterium]